MRVLTQHATRTLGKQTAIQLRAGAGEEQVENLCGR